MVPSRVDNWPTCLCYDRNRRKYTSELYVNSSSKPETVNRYDWTVVKPNERVWLHLPRKWGLCKFEYKQNYEVCIEDVEESYQKIYKRKKGTIWTKMEYWRYYLLSKNIFRVWRSFTKKCDGYSVDLCYSSLLHDGVRTSQAEYYGKLLLIFNKMRKKKAGPKVISR